MPPVISLQWLLMKAAQISACSRVRKSGSRLHNVQLRNLKPQQTVEVPALPIVQGNSYGKSGKQLHT